MAAGTTPGEIMADKILRTLFTLGEIGLVQLTIAVSDIEDPELQASTARAIERLQKQLGEIND